MKISNVEIYVHTSKALDMNNVGLLSKKMSKMSIGQYLNDFVRCIEGMRFFKDHKTRFNGNRNTFNTSLNLMCILNMSMIRNFRELISYAVWF